MFEFACTPSLAAIRLRRVQDEWEAKKGRGTVYAELDNRERAPTNAGRERRLDTLLPDVRGRTNMSRTAFHRAERDLWHADRLMRAAASLRRRRRRDAAPQRAGSRPHAASQCPPPPPRSETTQTQPA